MMCVKPEESEFVESDPTGRYGRYNEILGKGASKMVYRAFDEFEGIEVAWNQVKLHDFLRNPDDLERLYCEIHLLKTLKHKNIMKFYNSWIDVSNRNINFVTEMFTSGTLRQYREKHRRVNIRAVKNWCRQILRGLVYLHSHDPPIIHRDLKCDNIFINGNQGEVKIGDLGLAAILRNSHADHCVGTWEFMAPEVYEEKYNELVDIYSFGMCVLEMVTGEYPYSECTHPAQIYKKVTSGIKPDSLDNMNDLEIKMFIEKCVANVSQRLSGQELLRDPFLRVDGSPGKNIGMSNMGCISNPLFLSLHLKEFQHRNGEENTSSYGVDLLDIVGHEEEQNMNVDITIKGRIREDGGIFIRLRIADRGGHMRNIYFPFDINVDTALCVATEMVAELEILDLDVTRIAQMIDTEICSFVPDWKPGPGIEEMRHHSLKSSNVSSCGSFFDRLSTCCSCHLCSSPCASMHGRFGEITYQVESNHPIPEEASEISAVQIPATAHLDEVEVLNSSRKFESKTNLGRSRGALQELLDVGEERITTCSSDSYENEIQQELRWLKARYQIEVGSLLEKDGNGDDSDLKASTGTSKTEAEKSNPFLIPIASQAPPCVKQMKSFHVARNFTHFVPSGSNPGSKNRGSAGESCSRSRPVLQISDERCETKHYNSPDHRMLAGENVFAGFIPAGEISAD